MCTVITGTLLKIRKALLREARLHNNADVNHGDEGEQERHVKLDFDVNDLPYDWRLILYPHQVLSLSLSLSLSQDTIYIYTYLCLYMRFGWCSTVDLVGLVTHV